jgi:hypothetical protein
MDSCGRFGWLRCRVGGTPTCCEVVSVCKARLGRLKDSSYLAPMTALFPRKMKLSMIRYTIAGTVVRAKLVSTEDNFR